MGHSIRRSRNISVSGRARAAVSRLEARKQSRAAILRLNDEVVAMEGR